MIQRQSVATVRAAGFLMAAVGLLVWSAGATARGATSTYDAQLAAPATREGLVCFEFAAGATTAGTIYVEAGSTIQTAIDAALNGDTIMLGPGFFDGDVDFSGKAVRVLGAGPETVIRGSGSGPVVTFASGESWDSVLDSVTIRGGLAARGGGVFISNSSPTVIRTVIRENRASQQGSGVYVEGSAEPRLYNNLIIYNRGELGDPHGIQIAGASPVIVNNTIARGDSNGILISGAGRPLIMNNVIVRNGSGVRASARGRGICDFSTVGSVIQYNDFHQNRVAALLRGGNDWLSIERFEALNADPDVQGNLDGRPGARLGRTRNPGRIHVGDFAPRDDRGRAPHSGNPDPACNNLDGSRNTMGFTGGPFAPGSTSLPTTGSCGLP